MEQFIQVGTSILQGLKVIGGIVLAISLAISAYYFLASTRGSTEHAKSRIIGAVIGFILLMGATVIQGWLEGFVQF